jgi:calcineurin-like phosphoesterase family protein
MIYLIADTHFGHTNIIKYCSRPFANVGEMNETMITNWNLVVTPDDHVYHLGDFALGPSEAIKAYRHRLNGSIEMIMGNHDHRSIGFWAKIDIKAHKKPITINGMIFSHAPVMFPELPNIHGHIHEKTTDIEGIHICVSVEQIDYTPIVLDKIKGRVSYAQQVVLDGKGNE